MATISTQIDEALVRALVAEQFPHWANLPVRQLPRSGWDNRTFHLGKDMVARLPSASSYEAQIHREHRWLPYLRPHLSLPIPEPLAMGGPGCGYPWAWSVYRWIPGESAAERAPDDVREFVQSLGDFLNSLRAAPAVAGPVPGPENFFRGGSLAVYDQQFHEAMRVLDGRINIAAAIEAWESAAYSNWNGLPVWVHGDIALGNLLLSEGRLAAVIDFGQLCVGDPACDLAIAWTYLRGEQRLALQTRLALDPPTWCRGRAWALWKAAIVAAKLTETNAVEGQSAWQTMNEVLLDHARTDA